MTPEEQADLTRLSEPQLLSKYGANKVNDLRKEAGIVMPKTFAGAFICTQCGEIGKPKNVTKGSFLVEIFLWCMMLLPGLIYTLWRLTSKQRCCPKCGKPDAMIPIDSPIGQKLIASTQK